MLRPRLVALIFGVAAALAGWTSDASANASCSGNGSSNTCTISNPTSAPTTVVESYGLSNGQPSNSFFTNSTYFGTNVGGSPNDPSGDYTTTGITANFTQGTGGNGTVTLTFATSFAQTCTVSPGCGVNPVTGSNSVYAADIFIQSNAGTNGLPSTTQTFNYAIALGYTSKGVDGGLAEGIYAGNYGPGATNPQDETSTQIWGGSGSKNPGLSGWYGGAFAAESTCSTTSNPTTYSNCNAVTSPTVATGGTAVSGLTMQECWGANCTGNTNTASSSNTAAATSVTVTISGSDTTLASIFGDFDIFWGTGDCSNAPIWGNVSSLTSVPEPSSLALLLTAALGFVLIRRRNKVLSTIA